MFSCRISCFYLKRKFYFYTLLFLGGITIEAAYSWRKEDLLGSIQPGKIANFTILEQDPYQVDPIKLKDIPIWGTVFEGRTFPILKKINRSAAVSTQNNNYKVTGYNLDLFTHTHESDDCQLANISQQIVTAYTNNLKKHN
jgi:adenine deaminase